MGLSDRKEVIYISCLYPNRVIFPNDSFNKKPIKFLKRLEPLPDEFNNDYYKVLEVPCGKCVNCRLKYSTDWANRCCLEASMYPRNFNWFITLTYNDDNLPLNDNIYPTLVKRHLSSFIKRLRSFFRDNYNFNGVRFYGAGEYGSKNMRPHYHLILFNCPLELFNDFKYYQTTKDGFELFISEKLNSLWNFGYCIIGNFSWQSSAYVARYVMKKRIGLDSDIYDKLNIEPEFSLMSRKPGIAKTYFDTHLSQILTTDKIVLDGGKVIPIPHYFDLLLKGYDLDLLESYRDKRLKDSEIVKSSLLSSTDLDEFSYNEMLDRLKSQSAKVLRRTL